MRILSISLVFLAIFAVSGGASAQQQPASNDKSTEATKETKAPKDTKELAPPPAEKWAVIGDLKTGLQSPAFAVVQHADQGDFIRELVRVQWRLADPIDLWISRPKAPGKVPVILYLYNSSDSNDRFHDDGWSKRATADGFAAVGLVSALSDYRYKNRPMKEWFVSQLPESLGSTVHDVQLMLNYLASRGDMDTDNVGMFGMGSGASIAILAASVDSRIKTLDLLDPWGDWPDWLKESPVVPADERAKYLTPEFLKSVATLDPPAYLPQLRTANVRLQQTWSDPATPNLAKEKIAAAMPVHSTLAKYNSPQDLLKAWQETGLSGWLKQQMRPEKKPTVVADGSR
jgi:hypothetical protein